MYTNGHDSDDYLGQIEQIGQALRMGENGEFKEYQQLLLADRELFLSELRRQNDELREIWKDVRRLETASERHNSSFKIAAAFVSTIVSLGITIIGILVSHAWP